MPISEEELYALIKKANEENNAEARYQIGKYYCDNFGSKDFSRAVKEVASQWFLEAAQQGHKDAQFQMGHYHYCVTFNASLTFDWFLKAATQGHIEAQRWVGHIYLHRKQTSKAITWYSKAVGQGDTPSMERLALIYSLSKKTHPQSIEWYRKHCMQEGFSTFITSDYIARLISMYNKSGWFNPTAHMIFNAGIILTLESRKLEVPSASHPDFVIYNQIKKIVTAFNSFAISNSIAFDAMVYQESLDSALHLIDRLDPPTRSAVKIRVMSKLLAHVTLPIVLQSLIIEYASPPKNYFEILIRVFKNELGKENNNLNSLITNLQNDLKKGEIDNIIAIDRFHHAVFQTILCVEGVGHFKKPSPYIVAFNKAIKALKESDREVWNVVNDVITNKEIDEKAMPTLGSRI
jgi:TPR repeat protein